MNMRSTWSRPLLQTALSIVILAGGFLGVMALGTKEPQSEKPQVVRGPVAVTVEDVAPHVGTLNIEVDGQAVPYREILVAAEVTGKVSFKDEQCNEGEFVQDGRLLIRVDPADYELEVQRLSKQAEQANVNIEEIDQEITNAEDLLELADKDLDLRMREVARLRGLTDDRTVTVSDFERAQQSELSSRNARLVIENQRRLLQTRRAGLESAQALAATQLEQANLDLQRTTVLSPVAGVIVTDLVEEGDYVQKGDPLIRIEDTSLAEVRCSLQMEDLYWIWSQQHPAAKDGADHARESKYVLPPTPATVLYQLAGREEIQYSWHGVLSRYDGIGIDEATRTTPCRVVVEHPRQVTVLKNGEPAPELQGSGPPALVRGMFVTIQLHASPQARLLRIPHKALRPGKKIGRVRDGRVTIFESAELSGLALSSRQNGQADWLLEASQEILADDDVVITSSLLGLRNGDPVSVQQAAEEARMLP